MPPFFRTVLACAQKCWNPSVKCIVFFDARSVVAFFAARLTPRMQAITALAMTKEKTLICLELLFTPET
jgi:hypothetical protein